MTRPLADLTEALLGAARAAGADAADTIALHSTAVSIGVRAGALEQADRAEETEIGLRVFLGQKVATVASSDTSDDALRMMAERCVAMAREAPEDPYAGLAEPGQLSDVRDAAGLDLIDPGPEPDPADLQDAALRAEAAATAVPGVTQVQSAGASYDRRSLHMAATNGFSGGYGRTDHSLSCVAISGTGTGMERDADYDMRVYHGDLRDAADIGRSAGERAVALHGARRPRTGAYPVVFDERISSSLIGHLLQAINGATIARGSSFLRDAMGEAVLPKGLSVIDDPHRARTFGARPFDADGLRTQPRALVEDGILQSWVLDLATGRKLGLDSTASAGRGTTGPSSPRVSNIALTQGDQSRADLLAEMGTGLLVTSMIGSTINPNTGDYSRGASGFWVENGEIAYPVNECTVAGNLRDMLLSLTPANDARPHLSRVVPSLRVEGLTLAGE